MAASAAHQLALDLRGCPATRPVRAPSIVVGVTHSQTCLVLEGRLRALREAGFHVTVVASPGALLHQAAARAGVEAAAIPMERGIAPFADLVSLVRLWRLLGRLHPDAVEFSTPKAGLLGSIAAGLRGVPRRVYLLRGLRLETASGLKRSFLLAAERLAAACAHVVLCNSESLRARAAECRLAPESKLRLLGDGSSNGVDLEQFSPGPACIRERLGLSQETKVVGFVGRLTRDKGVPELIDAYDAILRAEPATHLLLVGWLDASDDALDAVTRARIASHPRIHCTGMVSETAPYYRAMDVMVLPSWREGFPNVVLEAAATGVPVVTTTCTGSRDSVVPEVTGLLIPPGDPAAVADAVLSLLRDPERSRCMGDAARAWVKERFSAERVLGLTAAFYWDLHASAPVMEAASILR
jgi:glycosyltransferase involved in cell wall biosynthesis